MQNIISLVKPNIDVELSLIHLKCLSIKIKELDAEYNLIKKHLIDSYFITNESYTTSKGLELATYKPFTSQQFAQTKFKEDHLDIYQLYSSPKTIYKFLLK